MKFASVSVDDVLDGKIRMPFLCPSSWRSAQQSDLVCRTAFNHLLNGTRPQKKTNKDSRDVKTALRIASINRNKTLLVVRRQDPFVGSRELIFCPKDISCGLISALHLLFNHASKTQLKKIFDRYYYATGSLKCIDKVIDDCNLCNALKKVPRELFAQSTSVSDFPGKTLSADVMRRFGQKILVVRDTLTSFTSATFTKDETVQELRAALLITCLPMQFQSSVIRVDCAPALRSLQNDSELKRLGIEIDLGNEKNPNKNPVADKAIQELELEILKLNKTPSSISASSLVQAVCNLNARIRHNGLSAKEMFLGRDQVDGSRLCFTDNFLSMSQNQNRVSNHLPSATSKARGGMVAKQTDVSAGSLVYIKHEGDKFNPRESYIVVQRNKDSAIVQKMDKGKFRSRQYVVPLSHIFPCIDSSHLKGKEKDVVEPLSSSSDDDDIVVSFDGPTVIDNDASVSNSDSSDSNDNDCTTGQNDPSPRRSTRLRHLPDRFGDVLTYNSSRPLPGEDAVTSAWLPGYPRGSYRYDN